MGIVLTPFETAVETKRRETLLRAAEIIEQDGWTQNPARSMDANGGPVCLLGAIGRAIGPDAERDFGGGLLQYTYQATGSVAANKQLDEDADEADLFWQWNDDTAESAEEVAVVLRRMADGIPFVEARKL